MVILHIHWLREMTLEIIIRSDGFGFTESPNERARWNEPMDETDRLKWLVANGFIG